MKVPLNIYTNKIFIRKACKIQLERNLASPHRPSVSNDMKIAEQLRQKNCFYRKSDKGNKAVILNKSDHFERVDNLINNDPINLSQRTLCQN